MPLAMLAALLVAQAGTDKPAVTPAPANTHLAAAVRLYQKLDLDAALDRLAALDPRQARIIELRFFGGLTEAEIAVAIGISERTVKREWKAGKAWLYGELHYGSSRS